MSSRPVQIKLAGTISAACDECASLQSKLVEMTWKVAACKEQLSVLKKDLEDCAQGSEQIDGVGAGGEMEIDVERVPDVIAGVDINGAAAEWLRLL
jgi:hypothetical protein